MINQRVKDDLDKTFDRLIKKPGFRTEWEKHEIEYELGRQVLQSRIEKNLSQQELATKADTTQAVISRIESMSVSPSIQLVDRIARAFGKRLEIKFV